MIEICQKLSLKVAFLARDLVVYFILEWTDVPASSIVSFDMLCTSQELFWYSPNISADSLGLHQCTNAFLER